MKVTESYWKDTAAVWGDTNSRLSVLAISDFPSRNYAKFYSTKRKSVKMLRIHHLNLFHIHRSLIIASNFWILDRRSCTGDTNVSRSSFVWSNKILHNYLKESQPEIANADNPHHSISQTAAVSFQ